jgi:hypothetical protein
MRFAFDRVDERSVACLPVIEPAARIVCAQALQARREIGGREQERLSARERDAPWNFSST